ncbi:SAM-dependent methyltransferase, partial [Klebsiella variicola]|uniref:SAM-dependent methyltransferase n=1 Tax=Klebsiella variicola TaxID=244366 RepID=UPI002731DC03
GMADTLELHLVGIGTGNPDHLTLAAIEALNGADLILLPRKGEDKADLADLRREICARVLRADVQVLEFDLPVRASDGDYLAAVAEWHDAI